MKSNKLYKAATLSALTGFATFASASGGAPASPTPTTPSDSVNIAPTASASHSLAFDSSQAGRKIVKGSKTFNGETDRIFKDGYGREVNFRGFNVSGTVKLKEFAFKPFKDAQDAATSFNELGKKNGSNQVRFTIAWEGVHPAPDTIDYAYLADLVAQMKEAIRNRMYLVVDYHSDLYSRHTFTKDSRDTGNGAPEWIVKGANHGTDNCGIPCLFSWGAHKMNDDAVRSAMRAFWLNSDVQTSKGTRQVQTEFLWQLGKVAEYLKANLSAEEFDYILGIEPINEPFEAGLKELGLKNYSEFDNQLLWPFYERVRAEMNTKNWRDKWVFAEPMVFWSSVVGIIAPATGGSYLKYKPGDGFVFAPHFYDQGRMGTDLSVAENGTYFKNLDLIRKEARYLDLPIFLGEFGMWVTGKNNQDTARIINGTYQGMESSDRNNGKDRYLDFYTPLIGGTQWHWDYYYDHHYELQNDNPNKVVTKHDAWNRENFSVVKDYLQNYTMDANLIERLYPRRIQGDLMNFYYNAVVKDQSDKQLSWAAIRASNGNKFRNKEFFRDQQFAFMAWRGRNANMPSELFIPKHMDPSKLLVITEKVIKNKSLTVRTAPNNTRDEVIITKDTGKAAGGGHRLLVWDDAQSSENQDSIHFVLVVDQANGMTEAELVELQQALIETVQVQKRNPVYLANKMTHKGYPRDYAADGKDVFTLRNQASGLCLDVSGGSAMNGTNVQTYACNRSDAQFWKYDEVTGRLHSAVNYNKCLDMAGNYSNGANVKIWDCKDIDNQRFSFVGETLRTRANTNLAVTAFGATNSSNVGLANSNSNKNQSWTKVY